MTELQTNHCQVRFNFITLIYILTTETKPADAVNEPADWNYMQSFLQLYADLRLLR